MISTRRLRACFSSIVFGYRGLRLTFPLVSLRPWLFHVTRAVPAERQELTATSPQCGGSCDNERSRPELTSAVDEGIVVQKKAGTRMEGKGSSQTAVRTAMLRAAHYLLDAEPKILADPFARTFAGFSTDEELIKALNALAFPDYARMRTLFALRSRYAEDELGQAVQRGNSQYVILGAGLDSFAYRRPDLMRTLEVYEVDHPASQAWKRERVTELGMETPATLHYVPIDFERETFAEGLAAGGVDRNALAFFTWLGVTQYLTREAVLRTLGEIAGVAPPGSELVFQSVVPAAMLSKEEGAVVTALATRAAGGGEPWLSFFEPGELERSLGPMGFRQIFHFGPEQAFQRYLLNRTDGLRLPAYFHMIRARVG
jgi:methyltransferase (TIGR00027 family)